VVPEVLPCPVVPDIYELRIAFEAVERESADGFNLHKYGIGYADDATQGRWEQWLECRAAMLQGNHRDLSQPTDPQVAEYEQGVLQAGNSPVIPDGWTPVSERMPQNDVSVLTFDGMYKRVHHAMYGHWQCWEPEKITHWMPLPASPTQENI
ncbi:DUF551 domain-containing protein, partial [Klebsiella pneumoniae]|uniref:DUF551 domain-containing protein n=1 Tax=Klebsiella pneumoniae TaxID=573 RepID=UPI0020212811